jgi:hypothetical protein
VGPDLSITTTRRGVLEVSGLSAEPIGELAAGAGLVLHEFGVIRSEWIKVWSLRSTTVTLAVSVLLFIGLGQLLARRSSPGREYA